MDIMQTIEERFSCRSFLPDAVPDEEIEFILKAAMRAPSPLNGQPWNFVVVTNDPMKQHIFSDSVQYKKELGEKSGWKWLEKYNLDFLKDAPVFIVVFGDPKKTGADSIMEENPGAWREACGAAIQNMMLAAYSRELSTLWFTMFKKSTLNTLLEVDVSQIPLAIIIIGKPSGKAGATPRSDIHKKVTYLR